MRIAVVSALALWIGTAMLLSQLRWFSRPTLADRLRPYAPGGYRSGRRPSAWSVDSFLDVVQPLARGVGARLARVMGVTEELSVRLERIHSRLDPGAFRLRQMGWALATFFVGSALAAALRPPPLPGLVLVLGLPLLAFLVVEQRLASASAGWQRSVFLELPVVAEQLAMLLSAGFSLGAALNRLADRGRGHVALDLARVCGRIRQGLSESEALAEWAELAKVDALSRLVPVLALNQEASDLGRLVSDEARAIRREAHRSLLEAIERRGQQVWIPVTVAALVPGVIFLAVPFMEALSLFSSS